MINEIEIKGNSIILNTRFGLPTILMYSFLAGLVFFFGVKNALGAGQLGGTVTCFVFFVGFMWCAGTGKTTQILNDEKTIHFNRSLFFIKKNRIFPFSEINFFRFSNSKVTHSDSLDLEDMTSGASISINLYLVTFRYDEIKILSIHKENYNDVKRLENHFNQFGFRVINKSSPH